MIEATQHAYNTFVTVTYADDHLPFGGSLDAGHARDWLKRLRRKVEPSRIRFFLVGEYGDQMGRPHYHAALFGYPNCVYGETRNSSREGVHRECCEPCDRVRDTWGMGRISLGYLDISTAQYIAGYVTKKMTRRDDARLEGRAPEFARMSLRPGIGFAGLKTLAETIKLYNLEGVPSGVGWGQKEMPLGRYLRSNLRKAFGGDGRCSQQEMDALNAKMWELQAAAPKDEALVSHKQKVLEATKTQRLSLERKAELFKQRRTL